MRKKDNKYQIGQHIKSCGSGEYGKGIMPYGRVIEIDDIPERGIYQIKLHTGWCVYPKEKQYRDGGDIVEIVDKCNCGECSTQREEQR